MQFAQHGILGRALIEPPEPPSYNVAQFTTAGTAQAQVPARQLDLEPSVAGVDRPMSWSVWLRCSNVGVTAERVFGNGLTAAGDTQYSLFIRSATESGLLNQHIQFSISTNTTNFILIQSSQRFLKNRWYHVVITYSGSEANSGLKIYFNSIEDTGATKSTTGTYTGALNNSSLRMQLSSVSATTTRYRGNMRDLAIWDIALNQTQIIELFNAGIPLDVTTASFYGTNIEALWPLQADANCVNNATFNFGSVSGITYGTRPLSPNFEGITIFNALPGNTRYKAFGTSLLFPNAAHIWIGDGTDHVTNTFINKLTFAYTNVLAASPVTFSGDVLNALPNGLRGLNAGIVNGSLFGFTAQYDDVGLAFLSAGRYVSSDGTVGQAFGSYTSMQTPTAGQSINFYGKVIAGDVAGQFFVAFHEYTVASQAIYIWETTDNGANWSKLTTAFTGGAGDGYNEPCILRVATNTYVMLVRAHAGAHIACSISTDSCQTWSAPVNSGLAVGTGMADMCLNPDGQIVVIYADRGDGFLKISNKNNVATVLADPTDWVAGSSIWKTIDETVNILGYPTIVSNGWYYAISVSSEFSSTRADIFVGYGLLGA
jgi:hypothetical protein